jgi:bifunctional non-homologous end joining protein LigD
MAPLERKRPTVQAAPAAVRGAHWIEPRLVAEIAFTEVTSDGVLRHPSYLGLRQDKKPESVVVEKAVPTAAIAKTASSSVAISNRDRVLFPESGITKGDLADYYLTIAEAMLLWAAERPISLIRVLKAGPKSAFSKSTMPVASVTRSSMSPFGRRTAAASLTCLSRTSRAC